MAEFLNQANSPKMYALAASIIAIVLFQAFLFLIRAWKHGKKIGMTQIFDDKEAGDQTAREEHGEKDKSGEKRACSELRT